MTRYSHGDVAMIVSESNVHPAVSLMTFVKFISGAVPISLVIPDAICIVENLTPMLFVANCELSPREMYIDTRYASPTTMGCVNCACKYSRQVLPPTYV